MNIVHITFFYIKALFFIGQIQFTEKTYNLFFSLPTYYYYYF